MIATLAALVAFQAKPSIPTYVPSETQVLIIPTTNKSGDKYESMKAEQCKEADETLRRLFEERGFVVMPAEEGPKAVTASGVDLSDEENYRKDPLYSIGKSGNARIVVFTTITQTWQKTTSDFLMDKLEGFATMKTWVLDVNEQKPILSADVVEGRSTRNGPTGSLRQIRAVRLGLEKQLKPFLDGYKKVKK